MSYKIGSLPQENDCHFAAIDISKQNYFPHGLLKLIGRGQKRSRVKEKKKRSCTKALYFY